NVFQRGSARDGLFHGQVANDARHRRDQRIRIYAGMNEETAAKNWALLKGAIDGSEGLGHDVLVVNVGDHTDDATGRCANPRDELQHGVRPIDMAVDRILIGEHAPRESLTHHNDGLFALTVELVEITAGDDGNAERGKESGRDDA